MCQFPPPPNVLCVMSLSGFDRSCADVAIIMVLITIRTAYSKWLV